MLGLAPAYLAGQTAPPDPPAAPFTPDAPLCPAGQTPANAFFDDLESGSAGNFVASGSDASRQWGYDFSIQALAYSGGHALYVDDHPASLALDTSIALASDIVVPSNAYLHFAHGLELGDAFQRDSGGVVEYSTSGGALWTDAGSLFDTNGYNGVLQSGGNNPLEGRPAFVGSTSTFITSRVALSSLAGQVLRFRWRFGLASGFDPPLVRLPPGGWWLDDVRIYTCANAQVAQIAPNTAIQGQANVDVVLVGQSTTFAQGQTTASFGPGVTVKSTTVTDATHATVNITIASNAPLGARDVVLSTANEVALATNAFSVAAPPVLTLVAPNKGQPGVTLNVAIKGQFTHFAQGQTTASFGPGITVNSTTVTDVTHAIVNLTLAGTAVLGPRHVVLTTGGDVVTLTNGFAVTAAPADTQAFAYVVGRRASGEQTVTVIDTSSNGIVGSIAVGRGSLGLRPDSAMASPDGALVYVTNELDDTVSVIRTASNSVIATIPVGNAPISVAVSPNGSRLYVLNTLSGSISVISTATNTIVATIRVQAEQSAGLAVTADGSRLYAGIVGGSVGVRVIDTSTNSAGATVTILDAGGHVHFGAMAIDVTPDGSFVYVPFGGGFNAVTVISVATNSYVTNIPTGREPFSARIAPDGTRAYVANANGVTVINTQTNSAVTDIGGFGGRALEFTPDGSRAYVAGGNVHIIDTAANAVTSTITFDESTGSASAIAMTPGATRIASFSGTMAFGRVRVGLTSVRTLTISNTGNSPLTVNSVTLPPGFTGNWAGGTIVAGASQNILVTFAPTALVSYGGAVTFNTNGGTATAFVSGFGTSGPTPDGDFNGDGRADLAVFRRYGTPTGPSSWHILGRVGGIVGFGGGTDIPVPADYDGDGRIDIAVFRPSTSEWHIWQSSTLAFVQYTWGGIGDLLVPADYDGDGRADVAVFRPSTGVWYILQSQTMTAITYTFGTEGDIPIPRDYDGDRKADIAIFRPGAPSAWYIWLSGTQTGIGYAFGAGADLPVPADYDADGSADIAVYRPGASSAWYIWLSGTQAGIGYAFGAAADLPVPADYDADGSADIAVYRPGSPSVWYVWLSSTQTGLAIEWGEIGDTPVTSIHQSKVNP